MLVSTSMLRDAPELQPFSSRKLSRMVRQGKLFQLVRGLYETDGTLEGHLLSTAICSPSYLSFEYALRQYSMIPEAVYVYTAASFRKNKTLTYTNYFGTYLYRDVPASVFPWGVTMVYDESRPYTLATREKALCDIVYTRPPVRSMKAMAELLFDDLRIDPDELDSVDMQQLEFLAGRYPSTNVRLLYRTLKKRMPA